MKITDILASNKIAIIRNDAAFYPSPPYSPSENYPEYPFNGFLNKEKNEVYDMVRRLFYSFGLDSANFGTPSWNPLGGIIRPGDRVLLKPNLVRHYHPHDHDISSIITHGSVIRAVLDYVHIALKGAGEAVIGDASIQSCDFEALKALNGLDEIKKFYESRNAHVEARDFRLIMAVVSKRSRYGTIMGYVKLPGDPEGYAAVDLGAQSFLEPVSSRCSEFRVPMYDPLEMAAYHGKGLHKYMIPKTVLKADVVINLPKMKTHHKAGLTGALKNAVGINNHKDCLPHHRKGPRDNNGDEYNYRSRWKELHSWFSDRKAMSQSLLFKKMVYPFEYLLYRLARRFSGDTYFEGSWWGNDTIWRTILDLNRILLYTDAEGRMTDSVQRKTFSLVDGIVAGEEDGPLAPTPKICGELICGFNPVAVDTVMAEVMGFDYNQIPQIRNAYNAEGLPFVKYPPSGIEVILPDCSICAPGSIPEPFCFKFRPSRGWRDNASLLRHS
ncbi:MAG: DUF362 domain-containing protein [Nitrospirae bacterium]|nr:DUF362 domain-containing protein [Nitrospirota bacterium]